ncbi:MAG: ADP-glyceromanno-heptose 6-epimerase [Bdellovibrionales bacterium]|nr:ADP-glyceromanno-heptose 6-epimerase [Bdellovibrionales bacterium]
MSQNRSIVITGAAGFIGSYLARELLRRGESVTAAVDTPEFYATRKCAAPLRAANIPVLSPKDFLRDLANGRLSPSVVFHMGACSNTDETRQDYLDEVNTDYTRKLWTLCTQRKIPLFYASSAATYGGGEEGFSDDPVLIPSLRPLNLYGWSKQKFDVWAQHEAIRGATPPVWAGFKFFNVYGPGEDHKGGQASVVFHARQQFLSQGFVKLFRSHREGIKDGEQRRDFVWVGDVVDAMIEFSRGQLKSGIYNLGSGTARTFLDLVRGTAAALQRECKVEFIDTPERLREHYQYFTQAELKNLLAAGYSREMTPLEIGIRQYFQEEPV